MLFIMELANNHTGSVERGCKIIEEFAKVTSKFPQFQFAFKFQRRDLDNLIHPDFQDRMDIGYIKRFKDTQLSEEQLGVLIAHARNLGFLTICTPFDEPSVDVINYNYIDYIKIGSCSINDWPLLNKIASTNKPIIASVGGVDIEQIRKVVVFFNNRNIPLSLMYCVGLYPTQDNELSLDKIDILKNNFPNLNIGFSTHENPDNYEAVKLAVAKSCTIFEKHVDIEHVNTYSIIPEEYEKYLAAAQIALTMCKPNPFVPAQEKDKLNNLKRGAYLKRDIMAGERFGREDLFFAMPVQGLEHLTAFECSKYTSFRSVCGLKASKPVFSSEVFLEDDTWLITQIGQKINTILEENYIVYPPKTQLEISHHYGLNRFYEYGMGIITLINAKYCKKLLIVLPGQKNPEHYHKKKKETFFVLAGCADIVVDGVSNILNRGDLITLEPKQVHSISSTCGAVIEELSTTHKGNDSYYIDEEITKNANRKTIVYNG